MGITKQELQRVPGVILETAYLEALLDRAPDTASVAKLQQAKEYVHRMERAIDCLPDPFERVVLRMRYITDTGKPAKVKAVAFAIYGNDQDRGVRAILRIQRHALEHLELL